MKMFQIVVDGTAAAASASDDNGNKVLKRTRRHFPKTIDANVSADGRTAAPSNGDNVRATKELIAVAGLTHTFLSFIPSPLPPVPRSLAFIFITDSGQLKKSKWSTAAIKAHEKFCATKIARVSCLKW